MAQKLSWSSTNQLNYMHIPTRIEDSDGNHVNCDDNENRKLWKTEKLCPAKAESQSGRFFDT